MYRRILPTFIVSLIATLLAATPAHAAVPQSVQQSQLTCHYLLNPWSGGFSADLLIFNNGPTINGWTARWTFQEPTQLLGVWSAKMEQPSPHEMVAKPLPWNEVIPTGSMVVFGWTAFAAKTEVPTDITVNGIPC